MDQDVAARRLVGALAKIQHSDNMLGGAGLEARILGDDVVEAHQLMVDVGEAVERRRARLVRVDDRQHVAYAGGDVLGQLGNAADGDSVRGQGHGVF